MTQLFKKIFLLMGLLTGAMLNASCPANYTTVTATLNDSSGNPIVFSICYPSVVSQSVNGGQFNIYISIHNTGSTTSGVVDLCSFVPYIDGTEFTYVSSMVTSNPSPGYTVFDTVSTTCNGSGRGQFRYANGIVAGGLATATIRVTANTVGTWTYTANGTTDLVPVASLSPIITVEATCPTITASNNIGVTGCGNSSITGNLNNFVTGGASPYIFTVTGPTNGTVSVNNAGIYTFSANNVTGPAVGSFTYQAADIAGCLSNSATIVFPIAQSPQATQASNGEFAELFVGTYDTIVGTLNFTGGTAPYTITTLGINNGSVVYDSNTRQFTFTQTTPGASFFQYTVTDANGCTIDHNPSIYMFTCQPGNIAYATEANGVIYAICTPGTAYLGTIFQITAIIAAPAVTGTYTTIPFDDIAPDSTQVGFAPGLLYVGNSGSTPGSTFIDSGSTFNQGGKGSLTVDAGETPADTSYQVIMLIRATDVGPQTYNVGILANPAFTFPVTINVTTCPTITASDASFTGCSNAITGNLNPFVNGGSGPYTFNQPGVPSCSGIVLDSFSGNFIYTAPIGFTGSCSFEYSVNDSNGCTSPIGTVTLTTIEGVTANTGAFATCENESIIGATLSATGGSSPYNFTIVTNGSLGTATITNATTGTFNYVPNSDVVGPDSFTFQVTDANGCVSNIATVTITINPTPVAAATGLNECSNVPVNGDLNSLITSGSGPFTFTQIGSSLGGTVTIGSTGLYTFVPNPDYTGPAGFNYNVVDSNGCSTSGAVNFLFNAIDIAPSGIDLCTNIIASGNLSSLVSSGFPPYSFGPTGTDVGGNATVDLNGNYVFTPTPGFMGDASFSYQVTDSQGCINTGSVTITYAAPIASAGSAATCENESIIGATLSATGGTPPYTFAIVTNGTLGVATITNTATGTFNYVPDTDTFGIDSFTFQVTDANGCVSNIAAYQITINQTPVTSNAQVNDCTDTPTSGSLTSLVSGGLPPYIFGLTGGQTGGVATVSSTGIYTFVPNAGFSGSGQFGYQVIDSNGCFSSGIIDVNISSPSAGATSVDACLNTPVSGDLSSLVTSGFPPYVFGLTGLPIGGTAAVSSTGIYTFVPTTGFSGPGGFEYQVTDSNNCVTVADVSVNVDSLAANNGTILSCVETFSSNLNNYVNGGTGALTFTGPLSISCGEITINSDGSFTYTAPVGFTGPCDFVYEVTDAQGCVSTGTITVTIDDPTAETIAVNDCVNTTISGDLTSLFTGVPPFTFSLTGNVLNGTASVGSTGIYTFTPTAGFSGPAGFEYEAVDSNGCSATGAVDITVASPIISPTAINSCLFDTVSGDLSSLVTSGFPPYMFSLTGLPVGGTAAVSGTGIYTFTPTSGFSGPGGFEYEVIDSNGCEALGNVAINVDSLSTNEGNVQTCNDSLTGTLLDYINGGIGTLLFTGPLSSTCGVVTIASDGSFTYNAPSGFTGPCNFVYQVTDSIDCSTTGSLTIVANTASQVLNSAITSCSNGSVSDTLADLVVGEQQPPLTFAIVTQPVHGTITSFDSTTGAYTYVPSPGYIGTDSFQFQVTDGNGCVSNIGTITVSVVSCCPLSNDPMMRLILQMYWGFSGPTGV